MPKIYDRWGELKLWIEKFDSEELITPGLVLDKMEELDYEYE